MAQSQFRSVVIFGCVQMEWKNDNELFQVMREHLFTAIIGDVLDLNGYHHQFLPARCRPLAPRMVVAGRAMTVLEADVLHVPDPPFGKMLEALDSLQSNEVYIAAGCAPRYALWGELMSVAARTRGAAGAVILGYSRDTKGILDLDFPTFCYGSFAQDQRGRGQVIDYRVPLEIEGVSVRPGDLLFGDIDGVVVLPYEMEVAVVTKALEQVRKEKTARAMLLNGESAHDVFSKTGVL
jgi:regulator of RNase E activity RraA